MSVRDLLFLFSICFFGSSQCFGGIIISQYYEGPSTNKWIELFNNGPSAIDLSTVTVGLWSNAAAEGYKTSTAANSSVTLSGSLAVGSTFLLGNTGNTTPAYAVANSNSNAVMNFNGNDSIALYTTGAFTTANLLDAIGFTNSGNQGVDKSFIRLNSNAGFDAIAGSNVTSFASVWGEVTLASVDAALANTDSRLGFSSITAVPEPSSIALLSLVGLGGVAVRQFRKGRAG